MMKHAWDSYAEYAWGADELRPITKAGTHFSATGGLSSTGVTIVDSLDTLFIMGLMDEFHKARQWVATSFKFEGDFSVSVFETNIRIVGGFLAAFALTGDELFKVKAKTVVDKLMPAFNTSTGIPCPTVNIGRKNGGQCEEHKAVLAEAGSLHLEFAYLSEITGDNAYLDKVQIVRQALRKLVNSKGLYSNDIGFKSLETYRDEFSMGGRGDSFYEYLYKSYLLSGKQDTDALDMYEHAIEAQTKHLLRTSKTGLKYFGQIHCGSCDVQMRMEHLGCFVGGTLALSARDTKDERGYLQLGADIAHTCRQSYQRTPVKLGPDDFEFNGGDLDAVSGIFSVKAHFLRPEVVETYFYLWRITKQQKYRDWAWEVVQALEKHCHTATGYSTIHDVYDSNPRLADNQPSYFLAETLKYLFLIFSDDSLLPLDAWVFNTEAHPLPVHGKK
ncbi:hypothetical protein V1264_005217 [Littorina saxatilis]|uniref:alpha-1,2-Mannosidase n=2 Tax=Littorina saxatilis TaxID=31220 RepID=A0AAN9AZF8_9CAEN